MKLKDVKPLAALLEKRKLLISLALFFLTLLGAAAAYAYTICYTYSDGCTICDFYSPKDEHQGSIEWCR